MTSETWTSETRTSETRAPDTRALEIRAEQGLERYTAYLDGRPIGTAQWILVRDTILLPHVRVDSEHADKGIGSLLMRRILDDARLQHRTVLALCPYAKRWAQLHPD